MERKTLNLKTKLKSASTTTVAKPRTPDLDTYLDHEKIAFARRGSVSHSPPTSEVRSEGERAVSEAAVNDQDSVFVEDNSYLIDIKNERIALEDFLFNESNKISRVAIKYILSK